MKSYVRKIMYLICILSMFLWIPQHVCAKDSVDLEEIKNGIIEVQSGFKDSKGRFRKVKTGSGFLISNQEGKTYVVTGNRIAWLTKKEKDTFCTERGISMDGISAENVVKIVVKGDITVETTILMHSKEKDFAILNADNVINEKSPLRLRDDFEWEAGKEIYLMAFRQETKKQQFTGFDVNMYTGKIEMLDVNLDKEYSFHYSAELPEDYVGGVLLDEEGYVIGLQNQVLSKDEEGYRAATTVKEIIEVLDNYSIYYDSSLKDEKREQLQDLYKECTEMYESNSYKKESLVNLQAALEKAKSVEEIQNVSLEELGKACDLLNQAKESAVLKTKKIVIIVWILAVIIAGLLIGLIQLLIRNYLDGKKEKGTREQKGENVREVKSVDSLNEERKTERAHSQFSEEWQNGTVLLEENRQSLMLIQESTGQQFPIKKPQTIIGKGADVDLRIEGNTAISRKHAAVICAYGEYRIKDMGSLNGTHINGRRIMESEEVSIGDGDIVVLANERFVVRQVRPPFME